MSVRDINYINASLLLTGPGKNFYKLDDFLFYFYNSFISIVRNGYSIGLNLIVLIFSSSVFLSFDILLNLKKNIWNPNRQIKLEVNLSKDKLLKLQ